MSTRHLVDPELLPALDQWPEAASTMDALVARRAALVAMMPPAEGYARPDVTIERRTIPGPSGAPDVALFLYRPKAAHRLPAYLHMHGGGYVFGCAEMCGAANAALAAEAQCLVVSVDYRLAPETRAPGSLEDCYAALGWLHADADGLGVDRTRIAIGGESAGGGLAAALSLLARDRAEYAIRFQSLASPMLDDRTALADPETSASGEFVWTRTHNRFAWESLLGHEAGRATVSPYHAPGRAGSLTGLPPAFIGVGALDLFAEENIRYALRLLRAGIPTEMHVWPGAYHGFERTVAAGVVRSAEHARWSALKRALAG